MIRMIRVPPSTKLWRTTSPGGITFVSRLPREWPRSKVSQWLQAKAAQLDAGRRP